MKCIWFSFFYLCFCVAREMTLEEKIGQMLIVHFHGEEANEEARSLIQELHVGGLIYYDWGNGLTSPEQVRILSQGLQAFAKHPLFLCIDQEGGIVSRLKRGGFTLFPGNRALGVINDPQLVESCAYAMGLEMQAVGINVVFAPVVDINSNLRNPVIGLRAYDSTPEKVTQLAYGALRGFQRAHIIPTLKHFPGHGDVEVDSHYDLPIVSKSLAELLQVELYPYKQLLSQVEMVMTAHISLPLLDAQECATFSQPILSNLLRKELGFSGLIISDSLVMRGLLKSGITPKEAALKALEGGCDLLLLGGRELVGRHGELGLSDVREIHRFLVQAAESGKITEERIDYSVQKILHLKAQHPPHTPLPVDFDAHRELAQRVAECSVRLLKTNLRALNLSEKRLALLASPSLQETLKESLLFSLSKETHTFEKERNADLVIACISDKTYDKTLLECGKPFILLLLKEIEDPLLFQRAEHVIALYSPTLPSLNAAARLLKNR